MCRGQMGRWADSGYVAGGERKGGVEKNKNIEKLFVAETKTSVKQETK